MSLELGLEQEHEKIERDELKNKLENKMDPLHIISRDDKFNLAINIIQKMTEKKCQLIGNSILQIGKQDIKCGRSSIPQKICQLIFDAKNKNIEQNIKHILDNEITKLNKLINDKQNVLYLGFMNVRKKLSVEDQDFLRLATFLREFFKRGATLDFNGDITAAEELFTRVLEERKLKNEQPNEPIENIIKTYSQRFLELPLDREIPIEGNFRVRVNKSTQLEYNRAAKRLALELPNPTHEKALRFITRIALEKPDGTYGIYRAAFRIAYPEIWTSIKDVLPRGHEIENHKKHLELAGRHRRVRGRDLTIPVEGVGLLLENMPISSARCVAVLYQTGCRIGELSSMRIRCHGKKMDTITIKRKIEKVVDEIYHETVIKKGDPDWDFWHPLICELQGRDYYDTPTAKAVCPLVQSERSIRRHLAHARQAVMKEHPEMDLSWVTPHGFRHDFTSRKREEGYSDAEIDSKWTAQVEVKNVGRYGVGA